MKKRAKKAKRRSLSPVVSPLVIDLGEVVKLLRQLVREVSDNNLSANAYARSMRDCIEKVDTLAAENALLRRRLPPVETLPT